MAARKSGIEACSPIQWFQYVRSRSMSRAQGSGTSGARKWWVKVSCRVTSDEGSASSFIASATAAAHPVATPASNRSARRRRKSQETSVATAIAAASTSAVE
ncbi:hypothetical protein [Streptomyces sp. NPDC048155]|uniref:hypothetical protein n=1 Tax=Streptomyces sp. NPDC048155 TaxID=3154818 RepID=UPI0033C7D181